MTWKRSPFCDSGSCVWVWRGHRTVWVRDDAGTTLVVDRADFRALLSDLRDGRFR